MEKYDIEVLEKADEDMQRLGRYITEELQSPMAAERITDKIWDEIERLAKNPCYRRQNLCNHKKNNRPALTSWTVIFR